MSHAAASPPRPPEAVAKGARWRKAIIVIGILLPLIAIVECLLIGYFKKTGYLHVLFDREIIPLGSPASFWRPEIPGAAFLYAIASIVAKRLKGTPPHLIALIQVCVGIIMLVPLADFTSLPQSTGQWASIVTIGVVHTGLMYILLYSAIQRLPTHITGSLSFIYPIAAIMVDYIAFGHALQPSQLVGSAAILIAAAGTSLGWTFRRSVPADIRA